MSLLIDCSNKLRLKDELNELFFEICEKYKLNDQEKILLTNFSTSLTIVHKETFLHGILSNINQKMWWNQSTPLMIASQEGNVEIVSLLLRLGANIHEKNAIGNTAAMIAAEHGELEVVKILVKFGANLNSANQYDQTALMLAIEKNHCPVAEWIIETDKNQLQIRNKYNKNALIIACEFGKFEIAKLIIQRMEQIAADRKIFIICLNAIHTLQKLRHHENIPLQNNISEAKENNENNEKISGIPQNRILQEVQIHPSDSPTLIPVNNNNSNTTNSNTIPIISSQSPQSTQTQQCLSCQSFSSCFCCYSRSYTPLTQSQSQQQPPPPSQSSPPKPTHQQEAKGNTPLMFACIGDTLEHEKIALMLLSLDGIDINSTNQYGDCALSWAALTGRSNVISALLQHPDLDKPSKQNMALILQKLCSYDFTDLTKNDLTHHSPPIHPHNKQLLSLSYNLHHQNTNINMNMNMNMNNNNHHNIHSIYPHSHLSHNNDNQHILTQFHNKQNSYSHMTMKEEEHELSLRTMLQYIEKNYDYEDIIDIKESIIKKGLIHGNIRLVTLYFMRNNNSDILSCSIHNLLTITEQKEMLRRLSLRKDSLQLLVRLAALYNLHFDILKLYLKLLENSIALLDTELPIFYKCLHYGCLDNVNSGLLDDGGFYSDYDIQMFDLPKEFINFPKHLTHVNIVNKLVEFSLLFKIESYKRPMERIDLLFHLKSVDNMLLECFKSESFAKKETMQKFIEKHCNEIDFVSLADAFMRGPLSICIRHKISIVFNSGHVNSYVNKLYWGYMRNNTQNHIIKIRLQNKFLCFIHFIILKLLLNKKIPKRFDNIIECKSNLIFLRFNPSCMYFLEGIAKGTLLLLLVYKIAWYYNNYYANISIIVMIISMVLYEYGEICDNKFISIPTFRSIANYFTSIWNILDVISFILVLLGIYSDTWDTISYGRGSFSIAVIFLSISMLNYFGAYEPIGQLLIMVFAMMSDLMKFVWIFVLCIFGFCVSMYSLQRSQSSGEFNSRTRTFLSLFDAAFLNYGSFNQIFIDHDKYYLLGIIVEMIYIIFTAVVLLNLIIARMSATHDKIDKKSFEEWQYTRAFTVYSFLLLNERSPYSMLPPPFNLIPTFFSFVDYYRLSTFNWTSLVASLPLTTSSTLKNKTSIISISGTASDWIMGIIISFISPIIEFITSILLTIYYEDISSYFLDISYLILIFPIIYPLYVLSLIIQTLNIVTRIDLNGKKFSKKQLPICYYETQLPDLQLLSDTTTHSIDSTGFLSSISHSTINIKVIRLTDIADYLHEHQLPIVQIQLQNIVNYCGNCIKEGKLNYIYSNSLLKYPLKQLQLDNEIDMSILILDKDILTGRCEIIASHIVPSDIVRTWIANGRYEGKIELDYGKGSIQVVISTCILKGEHYFDLSNLNQTLQSQLEKHNWIELFSTRRWSVTRKSYCQEIGKNKSEIGKLFVTTTPEERTLKRREKLLFDPIEINKIFPTYERYNDYNETIHQNIIQNRSRSQSELIMQKLELTSVDSNV